LHDICLISGGEERPRRARKKEKRKERGAGASSPPTLDDDRSSGRVRADIGKPWGRKMTKGGEKRGKKKGEVDARRHGCGRSAEEERGTSKKGKKKKGPAQVSIFSMSALAACAGGRGEEEKSRKNTCGQGGKKRELYGRVMKKSRLRKGEGEGKKKRGTRPRTAGFQRASMKRENGKKENKKGVGQSDSAHACSARRMADWVRKVTGAFIERKKKKNREERGGPRFSHILLLS